MSILSLFSANLRSFSGTIETNGGTIHTESGDIILPRVSTVTITPETGGLTVYFGNPPVAQKKFFGIPVSAKVGPVYITDTGVQTSVAGRVVKFSQGVDE